MRALQLLHRLLAALLLAPALALAAEVDTPAWQAWQADLMSRVSAAPRAVATRALQQLRGPDGSGNALPLRDRLRATAELGMAAQTLSREDQYQARDWLEAGVLAARTAGPAHHDLLVDLLVLHAMDNLMQSRPDSAMRALDEAARIARPLEPVHRSAILFAQGCAAMTRGDGAEAVRQFDRALAHTPSRLHQANLLVFKALAMRRFAQPVSGMLRSALDQLDESQRLSSPGDYPSLRINELIARLQGEVILGRFKNATQHASEVDLLIDRLNQQGYKYAETAFSVVLAKFRREDLVRAEHLQAQRTVLLWSVGLCSLAVCVALTVLLMHFLQRRRLSSVSGQLQQLNQELSDLARARTRLLAAACHDLRQPAHALSLSAELALLARARGDAPENVEETRRRLQSISRNSITLTDMLGELMDQTRLAGGVYRPEPGPVSLRELFDEVQLQFGDLARRKSLALKIDDCPLTVRSDRHLLRRICFNLVSNAIKYTDHGEVHLQATPEGQGQVRLAVADTGRGIPEAQRATIFDDFVRLNTDGAQDSLGIGLAVVKRATELLGHPLHLTSEVGRGTTVSLLLPATMADAPAAPAETTPDQPGAQRVIALLEDDAESRRAVAALLEQAGFRVVAALSADGLAARLAETGLPLPQLLVTDLHLGWLDGLEQAQQIRAWPGCEQLPVLLITGDLDPAVTVRAQALGASVGHKPIMPRRLLGLVQQAL